MPGKIFVNYRRDDDPAAAARVRDGLATKFGRSNIFMDVDNLLAGQRFNLELAKALDVCDVLIAIIGARWMDQLKARQNSAERDYVREEISAALKRGIVVIPVRVGRENALPALPRADDLPEDIRDLVEHQKHDVAHERFVRDVDDLADAIRLVRKTSGQGADPSRGRTAVGWTVVGVVGVLAAGGLGAHYAGLPVPGLTMSSGSDALKAAAIADEKARVERENKRLAALEAENKRLAAAAAKAQRDLDARQKAEAEAKRKTEEAERKRLAALKAEDDRRRTKEEAKRKADEEAERVKLAVAATKAKRVPDTPVLDLMHGTVNSLRDCPSCPEMLVVPAGSFMMGSNDGEPDEKPVHRVTIAKSFAVGKSEVMFDEWAACVQGGGCQNNKTPSDEGWGKGRRPVINVSWNDAIEYVAWLSRTTGKPYRLLTEAEWEYAARAGTTTRYAFGSNISKSQAHFQAGGTTAVKSYKPNSWGLHDMHGNVWEWTMDCWTSSYRFTPADGSARRSMECSRRTIRGGAWDSDWHRLRSAFRVGFDSGYRSNIIGFRVARVL